MRHGIIASCATLAFMAFASQAALAHGMQHENPLIRLNNNISVAGGGMYQHYKEHARGKMLDKETGWVPQFKASGAYMSPVKHYFLSATVRYSFGHTNYNGHSTTGAAVSTHTKNQIVSVNGKIGQGFQYTKRILVTPFLTYGHRYWHRHITSTSQARGDKENYNMNYLGMGVKVDYQATRKLVLSAQGMGAGTFSNTMSSPNLPVTFGLGSEPLAKAGLKADYHIQGPWHVFGGVHYTFFKFGRSNTRHFTYNGSSAKAFEPNSTTQNVSMDAGVRYTF